MSCIAAHYEQYVASDMALPPVDMVPISLKCCGGHPCLASGHTYPAAPSALSVRVPGYLLNRYGSGPPRGGGEGQAAVLSTSPAGGHSPPPPMRSLIIK